MAGRQPGLKTLEKRHNVGLVRVVIEHLIVQAFEGVVIYQ
jgi:hypothetical protein